MLTSFRYNLFWMKLRWKRPTAGILVPISLVHLLLLSSIVVGWLFLALRDKIIQDTNEGFTSFSGEFCWASWDPPRVSCVCRRLPTLFGYVDLKMLVHQTPQRTRISLSFGLPTIYFIISVWAKQSLKVGSLKRNLRRTWYNNIIILHSFADYAVITTC